MGDGVAVVVGDTLGVAVGDASGVAVDDALGVAVSVGVDVAVGVAAPCDTASFIESDDVFPAPSVAEKVKNVPFGGVLGVNVNTPALLAVIFPS